MKTTVTPIQLTEEHKSKLVEMCKALFPEYKEIRFSNPDNPDAGFDSIDGVLHLGHPINKGKGFYIEISIHWFEFCMTHLRRKLNIHHDDLFLTTNPGVDTFIHPVDHLYEKFKNLSLK